jgi:N-acetylmuramoyl-L-alanine amidase
LNWWKRKHVIIWLTFRGKIKLALTGIALLALISMVVYQPIFLHTWKDNRPLAHQTIVVDAGHGGKDGGAIAADGTKEKKITLQIAKKLQHYLQQAGANVYLTRDDDKDLAGTGHIANRKRADLRNRLKIIREKEADMVISIHLNAMFDPKWRGAQTFYYEENNPSNKQLATFIQDAFMLELRNTTRLAKPVPKPVYLLKKTTVPAVLVECGFLSNEEEAQLLKQSNYQLQVAYSIYRAILRYSLEVGYNDKE